MQKGVVLCPIGQRPDAGLRAAGGHITHLKKARKAQVSRQHLLADGLQHLVLDALLLGGGDGRRKLLQRQSQRRLLGLLPGQLLHLLQRLHQQILRRHAPVLHADGHIGGHLLEGPGNGVQPRDPVVVVLHRGELELGHQLRIRGVDAAHLVHRHLPGLEVAPLFVHGKPAQQQFAADLFLVRESGWCRWPPAATEIPPRAPAPRSPPSRSSRRSGRCSACRPASKRTPGSA